MFEQYDERKKRIDELIKRFGSGEIIGDSNSLEGANLKRAENEIKQDIEQKNTDQSGKFDKFLSEGGYALLPLITGGLGALLSRRGQKNRGFALGFQAGAQPAIQIPNAIQERYQKEAEQRANQLMSDWSSVSDQPIDLNTIQMRLQKDMGKTKFSMVDLGKLHDDIYNKRVKYLTLSDEEMKNSVIRNQAVENAFQSGQTITVSNNNGSSTVAFDGNKDGFDAMRKFVGAGMDQVITDPNTGRKVLKLLPEQYDKFEEYKLIKPHLRDIVDKFVDTGAMSDLDAAKLKLEDDKLKLEYDKLKAKQQQMDVDKTIASMRQSSAWTNYQESINSLAIASMKGFTGKNLKENVKAFDLARKRFKGEISDNAFNEQMNKLEIDKEDKDKFKRVTAQIDYIKVLQGGFADQKKIDEEINKLKTMLDETGETRTTGGYNPFEKKK